MIFAVNTFLSEMVFVKRDEHSNDDDVDDVVILPGMLQFKITLT